MILGIDSYSLYIHSERAGTPGEALRGTVEAASGLSMNFAKIIKTEHLGKFLEI